MSCKLKHVGRGASVKCEEEPAGTGNKIYVFFPEDLENDPEYSADANEFTADSFKFKTGKGAFEIVTKKNANKVAFKSNKQGSGFSNTLTAVIDKNLDDMSYVGRSINNRDTGFFVRTRDGKYIVFFDPENPPTVTQEGDLGANLTDDKSYTITVAAEYMKYPIAKWGGTLTLAPENDSTSGGSGGSGGNG